MMGRLTLCVAAASVLLLIAVDNSEARTISDSGDDNVEIFDDLQGKHVEVRDPGDTTIISRGVKQDQNSEPSAEDQSQKLRRKASANWRLAKSLVTFRDQLNRAYPRRSKASDGYIGDAAHQKQGSKSDHNPWVKWNNQPIVTAGDFTKDIRAGVDTNRITDELQRSRDNRIKYVIANGYIMSGSDGPSPWVWRRGPGGSDYGHHHHMHISVKSNARYGDDGRRWNIPSFQ